MLRSLYQNSEAHQVLAAPLLKQYDSHMLVNMLASHVSFTYCLHMLTSYVNFTCQLHMSTSQGSTICCCIC